MYNSCSLKESEVKQVSCYVDHVKKARYAENKPEVITIGIK